MNWLKILITGAKIIAGIASGVAVFLGLGGKWKKKKNNTVNDNCKNEDNSVVDTDNTDGNKNTSLTQIPTNSESIISGLRKAQFICGGIGDIVQSLVSVVSSIGKLTGGAQQYPIMQGTNCIGGPREFDPFSGGLYPNNEYRYRHNPNWGPDPSRPYRITSDGTQILQRRNDFIVDMYPNPAHPSNRQEFVNMGNGFNGGFSYDNGRNMSNGDPI